MEEEEKREQEKGLSEQILEAGKQKAEDAIKDEIKKDAKKVGMEIAKAVAKFIVSALPTIMPFIVAITLVVGLFSFFTTQSEITVKASEINETMWSIIKMGDNGPIVPSASKVIETINEQLEKLGISRSSLEMGTESQTDFYLYKYMTAYLSTQLPYIENSNGQVSLDALKNIYSNKTNFEEWSKTNENLILQGIVKIKRRTNNNVKDLTFKNHDDFMKLVDEDKSEALNYFSISDDWQLCVAKYTSTTTTTTTTIDGTADEITSSNYTVDEVKIPYQTMISQYVIPFEFLLTLEQMTANPEYVSAVADLIMAQGEIEFTIFDSIETVTNDYTYSSTLNSKWVEEKEDGTKESKSSSSSKTINTVTVKEINTIIANVTKADVWVIKQNVKYTKNNTTEYPLDKDGITNKLGSEQEPPGDTGSWETDKSETTIETIEKEEWQQTGDHKTEIAESKFLGLWKNSTGSYVEGVEYDPNGKVVKYYQPAKFKYDAPVQNIDSDAEMICTILEQNETTQRHAQLMRYLIHYYKTGERLDISNIFSLFEPSEFIEISYTGTGFDVHDESIFITDVETLKKAFAGGYSGSTKLVANADAFLQMQSEYKVNAVFAAAVSIIETSAGRAGNAVNGLYNWFNMTGTDGPYVTKVNSKGHIHNWRKYSSDKEGIEAFGIFISGAGVNKRYYPAGNYTVDAIGHIYCPNDPPDYPTQGDDWSANTTAQMLKFYKAAGIELNLTTYGTGGITGAGGNGYSGIYTTGSGKSYVEYKQYIGPWAEHSYAGGTMHNSGCSVTSVAVILSGFGIDKNPEDLRGNGAMINIDSVLQKNGLKVYRRDKPSAQKVLEHLKQGNPVIIRAGGPKTGYGSYWSHSTGHYFTVLEANGNQVYVSNVGSSTKTGWMDVSKVLIDNRQVIFISK